MQADLGLPGAFVGLRAAGGAAWSVAVVPACFDQQPPGVAVPGQGDVPAVLLIAGGGLAGGDPEPGRELPRMREAGEVADLGDQPERGDGRDPAEPGQDLYLARPPFAAGGLSQTRVERRELALDPVQVDQQLLQRLLCERVIQALAREPPAMELRPRGLALAEDPPATQQLLEHPVTAAIRAQRTSSRASSKSRSPSSSGVGGCTNRNMPARYSETSFFASRRSVFTRSPARTVISDGATTSHATPSFVNNRHSANPPGPAS